MNQVKENWENICKSKYGNSFDLNRFYIECPVCHTKLKGNCNVINNDKISISSKHMSSKLNELIKQLNLIAQHEPNAKCVIFSQWTSLLDIIEEKVLIANKILEYARLDGTMSSQKREENIQLFQTDASCKVFLISLKAGGIGLTLTAANHVFMMDVWWNPSVEEQAFDRVHRIGQTKAVTIHRIVIKNSIEQSILKLQQKKKKTANDALDSNHNNNKVNHSSLNVDDLKSLFKRG